MILMGGCAQHRPTPPPSDCDTRIQYYSNKTSEHPRHYPSYALLGAAYLDKARETLDPSWLTKARSAMNRSLEIQPNFEAFKVMTALCNYAHRFEDALQWGKRAAETYPTDTEVTVLLVEAYMGLGKYDEARKLLPPAGQKPADFYTASAMGNWLVSQRRYKEAVDCFSKAAEFARTENVRELVVWAEVSAAGALMDARQLDAARKRLDAAANVDEKDVRLHLHRAELLEAKGKTQEALAMAETLLQRRNDPAVHRKAFVLARKLGQTSQAQLHFDAAEKGFQRAVDAGEIYTLEALARLYYDADVRLEQALTLAEKNLQYKRDIEAQQTLACIRSKLKKRRSSLRPLRSLR
jgi:tetratricopeptide (TPR) repeat protein